MYMAQNSSRKHFLGSDSGERYRRPCGAHIEPVFSRGRLAITLPFWVVPDEVTQPRTICSTTSICNYLQQLTALASPCLLTIPDACLVVGTCQVQCVELGAEAPSVGGTLQVHSRMQPQWESDPSASICPVAPLPLPVLAARSGRGKQKDAWLNMRAAVYCRGSQSRAFN